MNDIDPVIVIAPVILGAQPGGDVVEAKLPGHLLHRHGAFAVEGIDLHLVVLGEEIFPRRVNPASEAVLLIRHDGNRSGAEDAQLFINGGQALIEVGGVEHPPHRTFDRFKPQLDGHELHQLAFRQREAKPRHRRIGQPGHHARGQSTKRQGRRAVDDAGVLFVALVAVGHQKPPAPGQCIFRQLAPMAEPTGALRFQCVQAALKLSMHIFARHQLRLR